MLNSLFFAVLATLLALLTTYLISRIHKPPLINDRSATIDGLRGYLAFFVFLHHSSIWFLYSKTGEWVLPSARLYAHFGQSSVALFFMITGFLFFRKILDGKESPVDWLRLFVSRLLRLTPLYFLLVFLVFLVVMKISNFEIRSTSSSIAVDMFKWFAFTAFGAPDINGIENTRYIVAGVTWSLRYEWLFYFCLPLLAVINGLRVPVYALLLGAFGFTALGAWHVSIHYISFLCGIFAASLIRFTRLKEFALTPFSSLLSIFLLGAVVFSFSSGYDFCSILLIGIFFILVSAGASIFGLLTNPLSRLFGEFSYGIYLLHGIILFVVLNFIITPSVLRKLNGNEYSLIVLGITPAIVFFGFISFRYIESPFMRLTGLATTRVRSVFSINNL